MEGFAIRNKRLVGGLSRIIYLHTVVPRGIAVFLFSTKYNIYLYISNLLLYKSTCVISPRNALEYIRVRCYFAQDCEIWFIRGPPVLFERKKSNRTEDFDCQFIILKIKMVITSLPIRREDLLD